MSMTTFPSHVAAHTERSVSWWLLLVPLTFVAVGVTVLVVLTAAATGSQLPAEETLVAPAVVAPQGDTTVPSAELVLRGLATPTGETDAPTF